MSAAFRLGMRPEERRCRNAQSPVWRACRCTSAAVVSVVVVVAIFSLSAYNVYSHRFSPNLLHVHLGDEIATSQFSDSDNHDDDLSAVFCSGYEVTLRDAAEVYLLTSKAEVDPRSRRAQAFEVMLDLETGWVYAERTFYLLRNSTVEVTGCRLQASHDDMVEMLLVAGSLPRDAGFPNVDKQNVLARQAIPTQAVCDNSTTALPKLEYTVTGDGEYNALLLQDRRLRQTQHQQQQRPDPGRHGGGVAWGSRLNGTILRTQYDVSTATTVCWRKDVCHFQLTFADSGVDVVVRVEAGDPHSPVTLTTVTTECLPRVVFWLLLFGAVPLALVLVLLAFWGWVFCVRRSRLGDQCLARGQRQHVTSECSSIASTTEPHVGLVINEERADEERRGIEDRGEGDRHQA